MASSSENVLGMVTIGQSPRDDMLPQMLPYLPSDLGIRQVGALDGLTHEQILGLAPGPHGYVLHTRLRDGSAVTVGREAILPRVQACIERLERDGANPVLLLCTGEFPELRSGGLLIEPDWLLVNAIRGLRVRRIGVFVPLSSQIDSLTEKWGSLDAVASFVAASPYTGQDEVACAARKLQGQSLDLLIMDCMGYTQVHKQLTRQITGLSVILASSMVARIVSEVVDPD